MVTGNSGDNQVNVNVNIDGTLITELIDLINPSSSPSSTPSPEPTPTPSPSQTPSPSPSPSTTPSPNLSLLAWWKAENNGLDSIGGNDLQLGGNVKFKRGKVGKAFHFNGNTSYSLINPFNDIPTNAITVAFWMKSSEKHKKGTPFSYAVNSGNGQNEFLLYNNQNFEIYRGKNKKVKTWVTINDGKWHHVAVTWEGSNGDVNLYKDGILEFSGQLAPGTSITPGGSFVIGQEQDNVGGGFDAHQAYKGRIDEMKVFNQVLNQSEIINLM